MESIGLTVDAIHEHVLALQEHFLDALERGPWSGLRTARLVTPVADWRFSIRMPLPVLFHTRTL